MITSLKFSDYKPEQSKAFSIYETATTALEHLFR